MTVSKIAALRAELEPAHRQRQHIGLVPTMGYLHSGHRSLIEQAVSETELVVTTIFVNPLQFAATEDLSAYPRDLEGDTEAARSSGSHLLFVPSVEEMYPEPPSTTVALRGPLAETLEGASRPSHLPGVATVVAKLFSIVGACRAYFGEKDWQQLALVRRLVGDLSMPVHVVGCPTVREPDGLALSSRNAYLSPEERAAAPVVQRALRAGAAAIVGGERSAQAVNKVMADVISAEPLAELDYVAAVDAATLEVPEPLAGDIRLLAAARFGRARLIDNVGVRAE